VNNLANLTADRIGLFSENFATARLQFNHGATENTETNKCPLCSPWLRGEKLLESRFNRYCDQACFLRSRAATSERRKTTAITI
jgi:hypothetical protein